MEHAIFSSIWAVTIITTVVLLFINTIIRTVEPINPIYSFFITLSIIGYGTWFISSGHFPIERWLDYYQYVIILVAFLLMTQSGIRYLSTEYSQNKSPLR